MLSVPEHGKRFWIDLTPTEVFERVCKVWDLSGDVPVPREEYHPFCPACTGERNILKAWQLHHKETATWPWRCDVIFKCTICSYHFLFGVPITERMWQNAMSSRIGTRRRSGKIIRSREVWGSPSSPQESP